MNKENSREAIMMHFVKVINRAIKRGDSLGDFTIAKFIAIMDESLILEYIDMHKAFKRYQTDSAVGLNGVKSSIHLVYENMPKCRWEGNRDAYSIYDKADNLCNPADIVDFLNDNGYEGE